MLLRADAQLTAVLGYFIGKESKCIYLREAFSHFEQGRTKPSAKDFTNHAAHDGG
jgi:hypothetical protein